MTDDLANALLLALALLLPLSALAARRLEWSTTAKMALAWAAIFAVGYLLLRLLGFT